MQNLNNAIHVQIADILLKNYKIKYFNGKLYIYTNGFYTNDISILERAIIDLNPNIKKKTREDIFDYIRIIKSKEKISVSKDYINFKNCLYNIKDGRKYPHSSNVFTINQINAEYINDTLFNEDVEKILE